MDDDKINALIDQWHEGDTDTTLAQHLGMTEAEYAQWVEQPGNMDRVMHGLIDHEIVEQCRRDVEAWEKEHGPTPSIEEVRAMTAGVRLARHTHTLRAEFIEDRNGRALVRLPNGSKTSVDYEDLK